MECIGRSEIGLDAGAVGGRVRFFGDSPDVAARA
jgi:hypothetical protein